MEQILSIIGFVKTHQLEIYQILTSLFGAIVLIVRLTPSKKDDAFMDKIKNNAVYTSIVNIVHKYLAGNK